MNIQTKLAIKQPEIGNLIRELRSCAGLTQEQFAAVLGFTFPTINRWENGRNMPSPIAMKQIEKMLQSMGDRGERLRDKYLQD